MCSVVIDGKFLTEKLAGIARFCLELTLRLDSLLTKENEVEIVVPSDTFYYDPLYKNIKIVKFGKNKQFFWEQISLPYYIHKKKAFGVFLSNNAPIFSRGLLVIHDISMIVNPSFYSRRNVFYAKIFYPIICRKAKKILTVSDFTKKELIKRLKCKSEKIEVIYSSYEHYSTIQIDENVLHKYNLINKSYFFSLGSVSKNKNMEWVINTAKINSDSIFVIAGNLGNKAFSESKFDYEGVDNVIFLGYINDVEAKTLMKCAKAFIFPSFYEGFGLPPLEAMSVGTLSLVSDIPVLHEIYEESVLFINPYVPLYDINGFLGDETDEMSKNKLKILSKYSWNKSCKILYKNIFEFAGII